VASVNNLKQRRIVKKAAMGRTSVYLDKKQKKSKDFPLPLGSVRFKPITVSKPLLSC
jgi:hypothetical protein